jgi:hypothetical protein
MRRVFGSTGVDLKPQDERVISASKNVIKILLSANWRLDLRSLGPAE